MPELSNRQLKKLARLPQRIAREIVAVMHNKKFAAKNGTARKWCALF